MQCTTNYIKIWHHYDSFEIKVLETGNSHLKISIFLSSLLFEEGNYSDINLVWYHIIYLCSHCLFRHKRSKL
jgi:hypothetical protein